MRRPLYVRAVKEVVRLQLKVLCVSIAGIRVIIAMDRGRLKKCKRLPNLRLKTKSRLPRLF